MKVTADQLLNGKIKICKAASPVVNSANSAAFDSRLTDIGTQMAALNTAASGGYYLAPEVQILPMMNAAGDSYLYCVCIFQPMT